MKSVIALSVAFCLGAIGTWSAHAAAPKPEATIKNRNIEASILLDDRIKADPALAADCLAEGRKWLDKNAAEAAASRREDPQFFKDGEWTFRRK